MWPRESGSVWAHWAPLLLGQRRADWRLFGARNKVLASGRFAMPSIGRCPKTLSAACYSITNRTSLRARARYDGDAPILLGWHYFQWESTEILHIKTGRINFNTQAAVPFFFVFVFFIKFTPCERHPKFWLQAEKTVVAIVSGNFFMAIFPIDNDF